MTDELLPHYKQELEYFRLVAPEFARAHQAIAGRLRMSEEEIDDPHVERLIQAFAFLNARTRRKIDDDFSEISQAMLQVLYPHYLAPFPSAAIVRFALPEDQAEMVQGFSIPRGSALETEPIDGDPYRFRTCYPVTVWPIRARRRLACSRLSFPLPPTHWKERVRSVIRLELASYGQKAPIGAFGFERLRFFLNAPPHLVVSVVRDHLQQLAGCRRVGRLRRRVRRLSSTATAYGRWASSAMRRLVDYSGEVVSRLPVDDRVLRVSREVPVLRCGRTGSRGPGVDFKTTATIHVDICLDRHVEALERYVTAEAFQLGCSPIVNLFRQRAESIRLTHTQTEYRVIPDARRPRAYEVHSIDRVTALSPDNQEIEFSPFYSLTHHRLEGGRGGRFWHASRRPAASADGTDDRTEVFLSLVDTEFSPQRRIRVDARRDDDVSEPAPVAVRRWSTGVPALAAADRCRRSPV